MVTEQQKLAAQDSDLVALAERYGVMLHKHGRNGELAGACPCPGCKAQRDGFHVNTRLNRWLCHSCNPNGWHDAVELVMRCERLRFPDAVQRLLGDSTAAAHTPKQAAPLQQQQSSSKAWDSARAAEHLQQAQDRLWGDNALGARARAYLEGRGLDSATALQFALGAANVKTGAGNYAPAVCLPWIVRGELVSLAFRFLEAQWEQRYTRWGGAVGKLFGNHANTGSTDTLIVCEGELNALSIWQAAAHHVRLHVLSTGKQTNLLSDAAVRTIAQRYETVIVWADELEVTTSLQQQLAAQVRGMVGAMHSPMRDGVKLDANTLLQRGELGAKLAQIFKEEWT